MEKYYKYGNVVTFKIENEEIKYQVDDSFLFILTPKEGGPHNNGYIFQKLNIIDKKRFCKEAYGYVTNGGDFPQCKLDDYDALNRVIVALQKECDEYNKKHSTLYKNEDTVEFKINNKILTYRVTPEWLSYLDGHNSQIFRELDMNQKEAKKFCSEIYGYTTDNSDFEDNFPQYHYKDYEAATRIIKALQKKCEEVNALSEKEATVLLPKFKIGDKVRILPRKGDSMEYPCGYASEMEGFVDNIYTIASIVRNENKEDEQKEYYEEPYIYKLKENNWNWCSAALELVSESTNLKSIDRTDIIDAVDFSKQFIKSGGSGYDIDKVKQIKSINTNEKEIVLTINKNKKTF